MVHAIIRRAYERTQADLEQMEGGDPADRLALNLGEELRRWNENPDGYMEEFGA